MAIIVTEAMPVGSEIDRVVLLSPGVSRDYDLTPMLENTAEQAIVYWSPFEQFTIDLVALLGTADGAFQEPAAAFGFATEHEKLLQIEWQPEMAELGNYGDHLDYFLSLPWISEYVASWVVHR